MTSGTYKLVKKSKQSLKKVLTVNSKNGIIIKSSGENTATT